MDFFPSRTSRCSAPASVHLGARRLDARTSRRRPARSRLHGPRGAPPAPVGHDAARHGVAAVLEAPAPSFERWGLVVGSTVAVG
ncbi:hypothetical protein NKG05_16685 [Oerskovia sp. M15]